MSTPFDIYLYPGVDMHVSVPMKLTCTPLASTDVIPAGATIIPPQSAAPAAVTPGLIAQAAAASLAAQQQGVTAAEAVTAQGNQATNAMLAQALATSNAEAAQIAAGKEAVSPLPTAATAPPWEITFTERKQ